MIIWDTRFLQLAETVASWSKDPSTKTGAVIVRPNRSIAGVGFNGFPIGMSDEPSLYANRETKYSRIIHCEINALLFVNESVNGYTLYTWPFASCDRCCVQMIQAGITRFVFPALPNSLSSRWDASLEKSKRYIEECNRVWVEL